MHISSTQAVPDTADTPRHVAVIMDGNGRWAKERGLPRRAGHQAGTENIRTVIERFAQHRVPYLTLYAFSTENWSRDPDEVGGLLRLLEEMIRRETATWARIMSQVPNSRFYLKCKQLRDERVRGLVRAGFAAAGIAPGVAAGPAT